MSWSINLLKNEPRISASCAQDLLNAQEYDGEVWDGLDYVTEDGKLHFNGDHMEHMDYLEVHRKLVDILKKHQVSGDICFGSEEGDNAGSYWGYRFDGNGGMQRLRGVVTFEPVPEPLKGKRVAVTGKLAGLRRDCIKEAIEAAGGIYAGSVTKNTDVLVVGERPGSKLAQAKRLGVELLAGREFESLL